MPLPPAQNEPWKHHFVPRSLLKYFRPDGDEDFIFVFDKKSGRSIRPSLMNAGSQNGFNTYGDAGEITNFD